MPFSFFLIYVYKKNIFYVIIYITGMCVMKRLKIFIMLAVILILSGCSVEYDLTINEDNTINEKIIAEERTKRMESLTRQKGRQAITYLYDMFKRPGEDIKISSREDDYNTYATAIISHNSIDDYASKFSSDVFEKVNIERNNDEVIFTAVQTKLFDDNSGNSLIYDDITINIKIPYEVISNNANSIKGNVYTWKINRSEKYKTIKFSYKEGNKKDKINIEVNEKTYNIGYGVAVVGVMVLIIVFIILFVYIKNKKNNIV